MAGDRAVRNGGYPNAVAVGAPPRDVKVESEPSALKRGPGLGPPKTPRRDPMDLVYGLKSTRGIAVDGLQDHTQSGDAYDVKMRPEYTRETSPFLSNRGTHKGVARTFEELERDSHPPEDSDQLRDGVGFEEKMI